MGIQGRSRGAWAEGIPMGNQFLRIQVFPDRDNFQSVTAGNAKTHVCIRQNSAREGGEVVAWQGSAEQCTHCQFGAMTRCGKKHCSTRRLKMLCTATALTVAAVQMKQRYLKFVLIIYSAVYCCAAELWTWSTCHLCDRSEAARPTPPLL